MAILKLAFRDASKCSLGKKVAWVFNSITDALKQVPEATIGDPLDVTRQ